MGHNQFEYFRNYYFREKFEGQTFTCYLGRSSRPLMSPFEEAIESAQHLHKISKSPLTLCLSGGIDSEAMALAFLAAKVPFRVAIARYGPGHLNKQDTDYAEKFCEKWNLPIDWIDIDLVDFFIDKKKHIDMALHYSCRSPQIAVHIELASRISGTPIFAANPVDIDLDLDGRFVILAPGEPQLAIYRYFQKERRAGVPFFFSYSPEQTYSFWHLPVVQNYVNQLVKEKKSRRWKKRPKDKLWGHPRHRKTMEFATYQHKVLQYQQGGFQVEARPDKWTGFENARAYFRDYFTKGGFFYRVPLREPFDIFFRYPMEAICFYPDSFTVHHERGHLPQIETRPARDPRQRWLEKLKKFHRMLGEVRKLR